MNEKAPARSSITDEMNLGRVRVRARVGVGVRVRVRARVRARARVRVRARVRLRGSHAEHPKPVVRRETDHAVRPG